MRGQPAGTALQALLEAADLLPRRTHATSTPLFSPAGPARSTRIGQGTKVRSRCQVRWRASHAHAGKQDLFSRGSSERPPCARSRPQGRTACASSSTQSGFRRRARATRPGGRTAQAPRNGTLPAGRPPPAGGPYGNSSTAKVTFHAAAEQGYGPASAARLAADQKPGLPSSTSPANRIRQRFGSRTKASPQPTATATTSAPAAAATQDGGRPGGFNVPSPGGSRRHNLSAPHQRPLQVSPPSPRRWSR